MCVGVGVCRSIFISGSSKACTWITGEIFFATLATCTAEPAHKKLGSFSDHGRFIHKQFMELHLC